MWQTNKRTRESHLPQTQSGHSTFGKNTTRLVFADEAKPGYLKKVGKTAEVTALMHQSLICFISFAENESLWVPSTAPPSRRQPAVSRHWIRFLQRAEKMYQRPQSRGTKMVSVCTNYTDWELMVRKHNVSQIKDSSELSANKKTQWFIFTYINCKNNLTACVLHHWGMNTCTKSTGAVCSVPERSFQWKGTSPARRKNIHNCHTFNLGDTFSASLANSCPTSYFNVHRKGNWGSDSSNGQRNKPDI